MALARVKTWGSEILTSSDLNAEFNNILNNALSLISPLTGNLDANDNNVQNVGAVGVGTATASAPLDVTDQDSRTSTVAYNFVLGGTTSGTPADGIGTGIRVQAESQDESPSTVCDIDFILTDITTATEDSDMVVKLRAAGAAVAEAFRVLSTGDVRAQSSYLLPEIGTGPATDTGEGALYTKDTGGQPELFYREEGSGDEVQITSAGTLSGVGVGIGNVHEDTTPQLGGNLDVQTFEVQSTGTNDIKLHSNDEIILELGSTDGTDKVSIRDSASAEVAAIDSNGNITTSGTVDGRDVAADGTKLDAIESAADVTDATNVDAAGAVMEADFDAKGDILVATADNTPTNLTVGANNTVLMADSAQASGAKWAYPGWVLLGSATPSAAATVDFTTGISSTFKSYVIVASGLLPATDGAFLWLRVSTDAGSTFKAGASDYAYANHQSFSNAASSGYDNSGTAAQIRLGGAGIGSLSSEGQSSVIWIHNPASTAHHTQIVAESLVTDTSGNTGIANTSSKYAATTAVDGLRLLFSTGNVASGEVRLYGVRSS